MRANEIEDLYRGDTWPLEISIENAQGGLEDLAGCTLVLALKADKERPDAEAALTVIYAVPGPPPVTKPILRVGSDQSATVTPGAYWMGLRRVRPGAPPDVFTAIDQRVTVLRAPIEDLTP